MALWQARHVATKLLEEFPELTVDTIIIKTQGDKILDAPLSKIGGKGLFTKEIEDALLDGQVDLAVHSMKDVPTELPAGLHLASILEREDCRDVFISRDGTTLENLPPGSLIGTSSLRRRAFLLNRFPEIEVVSIRGNVDTRIKKIETENLSGVMLAAAGVLRMGFASKITSYLEPDVMLPAIGQGAIGIETRVDDATTNAIVGKLNHDSTALCVRIERQFLSRMGGGCQVPMAAYCRLENGIVHFEAAVAHPDGTPMIREECHTMELSESLGGILANRLIELGAADVLRRVLGHEWNFGTST